MQYRDGLDPGSDGPRSFTLITGIDDAGWREAAADASEALGVDIAVEHIGVRAENDDFWNQWNAVRGISDSGALLVRPDRHIAWRIQATLEYPGHAHALRGVLCSVLGYHHAPVTI